jgi:alcohol dehydrogenase, propanol-preferring
MAERMRAMVLHGWGEPLRPEMRPVPEPGPGEALLRVRAAGVGLTLAHIKAGRFGGSVPRVIGHEVAGEIVRVGPGVPESRLGERCLVYFYLNCGDCRFCRANRETLCERHRGLVGVVVDGGYAEYVCLPAENFIPIPPETSDADAAVTADAVCTPWHCFTKRARITPLDDVVIIGAGGGVGVHGVAMAKLFGARVIAVDVSDEKLALARQAGADDAVHARAEDVPRRVRELTDGKGADVCVDFAGFPSTIEDGLAGLAVAGTLVVIGVQQGESVFQGPALVRSEQVITGSRYSTKQEMHESIALVAKGRIRPVITMRVPLERVNEVFDLLAEERLLGRAVVTFDE